MMCSRWPLTVGTLMLSRLAISLFASPAATSAGTSRCRGVSSSASGGGVATSFSVGIGNTHVFFWAGLLHRSDGTETGTEVIKDFSGIGNVIPEWGFSALHAAAGDTVFFIIRTPEGVNELWKTDSTGAGTTKVKEFPGTPWDWHPYGLTGAGKLLYFVAGDGVRGSELWRSDGAPEGTRPVADIERGQIGSSPSSLEVIGEHLYFHAERVKFGREPHVLKLPKQR